MAKKRKLSLFNKFMSSCLKGKMSGKSKAERKSKFKSCILSWKKKKR